MTKKSNKIAALDTEYAKKKYAEFQQQQRQLVFRRRRLAAIFVGALVIFAIIGVQIFHDMQRMHQLNELRVEANTEMKEVNADVDQLHQDVSLLKDDEYVAKLARSKFFYSKDGEKVYPILESNTDSSTNETDQSTSSTTAK
ncbi:TPA: septum formation initiator family protein [Enterococcus faecium]|uniref:Septum formation initiator family protein n=1 Tax=Enterococcus faecium TaxID=1352 RepID=A0AB74CVR5_ENTFC|nr:MULTISPECIES: septum formation initiator family protein [Enterococcus]EGP4987649.1 septum formation initiator family protein [Enterococcus faecium]EGP5229181.1 septum formation initiator family protein [Enterococcus faecium]EGP5255997.1 septum formation initiator family protein [Enterococcus faecium]EME7079875.1 septum formation initiator family protein [Enterococcus faecium]EME7143140.1 septum formation initiator family protein [Enterococcus faecium]